MENIRFKIEYKIGGAFPVNDRHGYNNSADSLRVKLIKGIQSRVYSEELDKFIGDIDNIICNRIKEPIDQNQNNEDYK